MRDFSRTAEPSGGVLASDQADGPVQANAETPRFVIQKHAARRLHYDVRFEADGVLISWAVPKGPSLDPSIKRLAVHVEDHPIDYATFEGTIPGGEYGAGAVIVWDQGTYRNLSEKGGHDLTVREAVTAGHVTVWLEGTKLQGGWHLIRTRPTGNQDDWIMVKRQDDHADVDRDITEAAPDSVQSGRSLEQVRAGQGGAEWRPDRATWLPPMLAQPLQLPRDGRVLAQTGWVFERKLDGLRCIAVRNGQDIEMWSRNHLTFSGRFPQVAQALARLAPDNFTLDGELVAFDGNRSGFNLIQRPGEHTRIEYHAFDLIHLLGHDTTELPWTDRRRLLEQALDGAGEMIRVSELVEGEPVGLLRHACEQGWEGLIAKQAGSTYRSGRSSDWRKLKCTASQELVVGGWTDPSGRRTGLGALLVGYFDDAGDFVYAGKVGSGFDDEELTSLSATLGGLATDRSPFAGPDPIKGAHWVRPHLVVDVAFSEWTHDGRLRHPRFTGVREDKNPTEVRREQTSPQGAVS
jgi:bifunctional non-homologous end joining protein LigD